MISLDQIKTKTIDAGLEHVVDRIIRQYEKLPNAFQKEAIQNAWDARFDKDRAKEWKIEIKLFQEPFTNKQHLIIEDSGTTGMNKEKWESFLALWKPDKQEEDAGGQGQGKFVLMKASIDNTLMVESRSTALDYSCRYLKNDQKDNQSTQLQIEELIPGSARLNHRGTKVWICNVKKEFLKIIKSDNFIHLIAASWWQILKDPFNAKIILFGKQVASPKLPPVKESKVVLENKNIGSFGRIKRLVLEYYEKDIPDLYQGIRVQRANMMICSIPFNIHDDEYKNRFSGYILFEEKLLGSALKKLEKTDHCGFSWESPWKEIKQILESEIDKFKKIIIPKKEKKKSIIHGKLQDEIISKVNQIVMEHLPEIGKSSGPDVPLIPKNELPPCRIEILVINKREVKYGDIIIPKCLITNKTENFKKLLLRVSLKFYSGKEIYSEIYSFKIRPGRKRKFELPEIKLDESHTKGKYTIRATLEENRHDIHTKATSFYLEIKRPHIKTGFAKKIDFSDFGGDKTIRNTAIKNGIITVNIEHPDVNNIFDCFKTQKRKGNQQIKFYIIKIFLDEAVREALKLQLSEDKEKNIETINELMIMKDRMYFEIYT